MRKRKNESVSSLLFNDRRQLDDVDSDGKLFQVLAAESGNVLLPIVER